jgi:hypothetical protein
VKVPSVVACCSVAGSSAGETGRGRGQPSGRLGRRGRRSRLVPRTPALRHRISLGLHCPIPKERKKTGQLAELTHVVRELRLELKAGATALSYAATAASNGRRA